MKYFYSNALGMIEVEQKEEDDFRVLFDTETEAIIHWGENRRKQLMQERRDLEKKRRRIEEDFAKLEETVKPYKESNPELFL